MDEYFIVKDEFILKAQHIKEKIKLPNMYYENQITEKILAFNRNLLKIKINNFRRSKC